MAKATLPDKAILVWLPGLLHRDLVEAVASNGGSVTGFVRSAIQHALRSPDDARWRELPLRGGPGQEIDQQLAWILARSPAPSDWLGVGGELDKRVARELRRVLLGNTLAQKRVTAWLQGTGYEAQAAAEGVTRQAVHICVKSALKKLAGDEGFLRVLRSVVQPEPMESRDVVEDWING